MTRLRTTPGPPNWFVALPVCDPRWQTYLPAPPAGVRLLVPEDLHLTVAFLGAVDGEVARRSFEALRQWAPPVRGLSLGDVEAMGHPSHPSALSVRIEAGAGPLSAAIEATRPGLLQAAAAPIDGRPVRPHVTLARIPRRASSDLRDRAYGWARGLSLVGLAVRLGPPTLYTWSADRNRRLFDQVARSSSGQFPERSGAGASGLPGPGLVRDDLRPGRNGT